MSNYDRFDIVFGPISCFKEVLKLLNVPKVCFSVKVFEMALEFNDLMREVEGKLPQSSAHSISLKLLSPSSFEWNYSCKDTNLFAHEHKKRITKAIISRKEPLMN